MEFLENLFGYDRNSLLLFTGVNFWIFFGAVLLGFSFLYSRIRLRNAFLFLTSLFFYYKCGGGFVILLFLAVVANFHLGKWMGRIPGKQPRKNLLLLSIFFNLGMLVWFKYTAFFILLFNQLTGSHLAAFNFISWGLDISQGAGFNFTEIVVPLGISFFTFQLISYSIEVYRRKIEPLTVFSDFGFYITFFPQLVSGPIVKPQHFIPQIRLPYQLTREEYGLALFLILSGLVKKIVFADYLSVNFVARVFDNPNLFTGFESLLAVYGYTLQIYFDFSGYTDLAIGIALLLGFRLPPNFDSPYKARNISDFWKRWHMSLTTWFRDYLFLPLAYYLSGKMAKPRYFRIKTELLIYMAGIMFTFLLCGLWHGAALNFIIWGGLHGMALAIHKLFYPKMRDKKKMHPFRLFASRFFTFNFIAFTWIIFRMASADEFFILVKKIVFQFHFGLAGEIIASYWKEVALLLAGYLLIWSPVKIKETIRRYFVGLPDYGKAFILIGVIFLIYQFKVSGIQQFIYFQF
ncbi:MAG: MBOAT family protein [Bacteroidetes bacterium]|nr:MBOAT family protein [Bacteroidota bacterium]